MLNVVAPVLTTNILKSAIVVNRERERVRDKLDFNVLNCFLKISEDGLLNILVRLKERNKERLDLTKILL